MQTKRKKESSLLLKIFFIMEARKIIPHESIMEDNPLEYNNKIPSGKILWATDMPGVISTIPKAKLITNDAIKIIMFTFFL
jgi:hypothetical protein